MSYTDLQYAWDNAYLFGGSMSYVEGLYEDFLKDPQSVPKEWQEKFSALTNKTNRDISLRDIEKSFINIKHNNFASIDDSSYKEQQLIDAYRRFGHLEAKLDALNLKVVLPLDKLKLEYYNFHEITQNIKQLHQFLREVYCQSLGVEFMHLYDDVQINWFISKLEEKSPIDFNKDEKLNLLKDLIAADGFERYLGTKYVGQKRFSLEGADAFIPLLKILIDSSADANLDEVVVGMAHRGRLNALVNVFGKPSKDLFAEFEGRTANKEISGDVKYHLGYTSDIKTKNGATIHLVLEYNPSHLEIVGPVVNGSVRARSMRFNTKDCKNKVIPIIVHGDSAFSGQGVVMESLNFSQVRGYSNEGSIHIVINNQIGFTTSNVEDTRSTLYCTDVAKMLPAPILHVNGDDPVAVLKAGLLAFEYRQKFKKDIVIDLICYRRHGHNEADEPSLTQPIMYQQIKTKKTLRELYASQLIEQNIISEDEVANLINVYRDMLDAGKTPVDVVVNDNNRVHAGWDKYKKSTDAKTLNTAISMSDFSRLAKSLETLPDGFKMHPVVQKVMDDRHNMTLGNTPINWGYAEVLAYASLLDEGYSVRLAGQDAGRGTFAHRHAVLHDYNNGDIYKPLEQFVKPKESFSVIDSLLSEEAVLAFEYGYASSAPQTLVLWEAQFGDFANGAQVILDQFLSSSEQKWNRLCGLVMLLPHGYEGQGPEHSSARLERYLQLCAQDNMRVCIPSTPAQIFHLLRLQMLCNTRKPLIIMSPKSLLRHKLAVSTIDDLTTGAFLPIIDEVDLINKDKVERVVLCSGKIYYELLQKRRDLNLSKVSLLRIERLYPFPEIELKNILNQYPKCKHIVWCQEEPKNQGAYSFVAPVIKDILSKDINFVYAGRQEQASPAEGSANAHQKNQELIINNSLEG